MGCYDSVNFMCLRCLDVTLEAQSRAGQCTLRDINSDDVPLEIAKDLDKQILRCRHCGSVFKIVLKPRITYELTLEKY
jgi:DNA-directed RNA polymerase subunit RPC12/RpoP